MISRFQLIHRFTLQFPPFSFSGFFTVTKSLQPQFLYYDNTSSFTVSYLIDSCGLSPEIAISASKKVKLNSPQRPDSVLHLLKDHGFSHTQISRAIIRRPVILLHDPDKTLLPKLNFFNSFGLSKDELAKLITSHPDLLSRSLDNYLIPNCNYLKTVLRSDEKMRTFIKRGRIGFSLNYLVPNIDAVRKLDVPASYIQSLVMNYSRTLLQKHDRFVEAINMLMEMKFDPSKSNFALGLSVFALPGYKAIWDRCAETYKKWGWSEEDILVAFKKYPHCMIISTDKIDRAMDLLVNKFGYESTKISEIPSILLYNVERRTSPRCSVLQVLTSEGIIKKWSLRTILLPSEKRFLEKYVLRYEDQLPHLSRVYRGEIDSKAL